MGAFMMFLLAIF